MEKIICIKSAGESFVKTCNDNPEGAFAVVAMAGAGFFIYCIKVFNDIMKMRNNENKEINVSRNI